MPLYGLRTGERQGGRLVPLYLGHAPATIAARHDAAPPQALFDEAIAWLGRQFGVA